MNKQQKQDLIKIVIGLGLIAGVVLISRASTSAVGTRMGWRINE